MTRASRAESALLVVADVLVVSAAFALAYVLRFWFEVGAVVSVPPAAPGRYAQALGVVLVTFVLVLGSRGLYDRIPPRGIDVLEKTVHAATLASALVLAASFFFREFTYSRSVTLLSWVMILAVLPLPRLTLQRRRRRRYVRGQGLIPAAIVGSAARAADLQRRLANRRYFGIDVRGVIVAEEAAPGDPPAPEAAPASLSVLGSLADLEGVLRRSDVREVFVTDTLGRLELLEALETCERVGVEARVVPCVYDLFVTEGDLFELHGVPFLGIRERRFELLSRAVKRLVDLVLGGALLLLAAPVLLLLAWLVRRDSPGPAFFVQRRIGEGGRPFAMWKLRTMIPDAEARLAELVDLDALNAPVFKLDEDPRVTRLGRFLRRSSLDELPQLWNVVKGDMSLVGPRPEEEPVVARYDAHHRRRLKAKPGLTGLQQVEARATVDLDERVRLDVFYIRRRSLIFDLYVLLRTPWAVFHGEGAT